MSSSSGVLGKRHKCRRGLCTIEARAHSAAVSEEVMVVKVFGILFVVLHGRVHRPIHVISGQERSARERVRRRRFIGDDQGLDQRL